MRHECSRNESKYFLTCKYFQLIQQPFQTVKNVTNSPDCHNFHRLPQKTFQGKIILFAGAIAVTVTWHASTDWSPFRRNIGSKKVFPVNLHDSTFLMTQQKDEIKNNLEYIF